MKRKFTFMMLAIALLSITSCKASPMREQVNIDCVLQDSVQAILEKYLPDYGAMDGEVIVMETKSGKVLAQVGLNDIGNYSYERADSLAQVTNQMEKLMYYNTIANDRKKTSIRAKLKKIVKKGRGRWAKSDKFKVAGKDTTITNEDGTFTADFCGYFPVNNPQYTILVSVHRKEIPASGGRMSAPIFKEIAEFIYDSINRY